MITVNNFPIPRCACGASKPIIGYTPIAAIVQYLQRRKARVKRVQVHRGITLPWQAVVYMSDGRAFNTIVETQTDLELLDQI